MAKLVVATAQFAVSGDIGANVGWITGLAKDARRLGAEVAHFPEGALSGYATNDIPSHERTDWAEVGAGVRSLRKLARELALWLVVGSAHVLTAPNKPHNSLYFISPDGLIRDRYDKRFLSGDPSGQSGDLAHYSPGDHFSVVDINGVRCGGLICVDCRYPELYRGYKALGVDLVFHSFNAAHISELAWSEIEAAVGPENFSFNAATTYPGITQPAMIHAAAGSNHVWISCSNSSAERSCWPAFFMRPDGVITGRLKLHEPGVVISVVDTGADFYDSTRAWRGRAMSGLLHSGELVVDERSIDRKGC